MIAINETVTHGMPSDMNVLNNSETKSTSKSYPSSYKETMTNNSLICNMYAVFFLPTHNIV